MECSERQLYRLAKTPSGRKLWAYMAGILEVTGMAQGFRRFQSSDISTMAAEAFQYASPKPRATVLDCYTVLRDLEGGDPISTLCVRYYIDKTKIKGWLEAATQIQNLVTKAGNRRHFPKRMSSTAIGIPLAPIRPQDRATAKETDRVISLLRDAFGKDKGAIRWCIDYWKKNTSQTKQGIRFTCLDDAGKFINSLEKVIPKRRWELNILLAPKARIEELNVWHSLGISTHLQEAAQGKSIQAYLRLRHVNEDEIVGMRIPANVTGHSGDRDRFAHGLHAGTGFVL